MADTTPTPGWAALRRLTAARVALGRAGNGVPTRAHLAFQAAHAAARDAVWSALDAGRMQAELAGLGFASTLVHSAAADRRNYLLRPDLGRRLDEASRARLMGMTAGGTLAILVCDGLSAAGVQAHAGALLRAAISELQAAGIRVGPLVIATQGRVALGDDVGAALGCDAIVVVIGERPGLSAADSLGLYLTWQPRPGRSDAERNCISNIRPGGLGFADAGRKLAYLARRMQTQRLTGVGLKDEEALPPRAAPHALQGRDGTRPPPLGTVNQEAP